MKKEQTDGNKTLKSNTVIQKSLKNGKRSGDYFRRIGSNNKKSGFERALNELKSN